MLAGAIRYDGDLQVVRAADDGLGQALAAEWIQKASRGMSDEDLSNLIVASKVDDGFGGVWAFDHSCFDAQAASKTKMFFDGSQLLLTWFREIGIPDDESNAIGVEIIGDSAATANEHSG